MGAKDESLRDILAVSVGAVAAWLITLALAATLLLVLAALMAACLGVMVVVFCWVTGV